jgi:dehydrogenase/reductase SDR family member 7B
MNFTGKNIWITGASSGIGEAVAVEISKHNVHLILSGRNETALHTVAEKCKSNGSTTDIIPFDLAGENAVDEAVGQVISRKINIDGLYHFGGISQRSLAGETPSEVDRKIFEVNFFGTVKLTKAILPRMVENGGGQIAVTSSIVGKFGFPYRSAYSASKHALHGFFESLRAENVQNNIRVSVIIPGRIKTNVSVNALNKKGEPYGRMDEGQDKGKCAEWTARKICRGLQKERKEILVGGPDLLMVYIRRFFPQLYYYMASRVKPL